VNVIEEFLNLVLPGICVLCQRKGSPLCSACKSVFSGPVIEVQRSNTDGFLLKGFAVSHYSKSAATLVHELKENSQTSLASAMAKHMATSLAAGLKENNSFRSVCLVPIPSKKTSFQKRGFNPSLLLAKKISNHLRKQKSIKIQVENCLRLNREVLDQASQVGLARRQNLAGAISLVRPPSSKEIWLVDDVVTTGSTLLEAARCLSESGLRVSGFVVFAETLPKHLQKARAAAI
jgi:ComF family protein